MKTTLLFLLLPCLAQVTARAALTDNLVAYWDFEGGVQNHPAASGGSAFDGTLMGNATVSGGTPRAGTGALHLDGNGDYLDVTSIVPVNSGWSVAAWYRSDVAYADAARGFVFETSGGFPISYGLREGSPATETGHQLYTNAIPAGGLNQTVQIADAETAATWHQILLVFTPATASAAGSIGGYLDGVRQFNLVIPTGNTLATADGFHLGTYRGADDRWFAGSIDEVGIWNKPLTPMEALELHQRGLANIGIAQDLAEAGKKFVGVLTANAAAGTVSGGGIFDAAASVPVTATPVAGYAFSAWTGDFAGQPAAFSHTAATDARAIASFAPVQGEPRWWKGNLHTHTFWSDGDDFPEMVTAWYRDAGYHFLSFSEHNLLQGSDRWKTVDSVDSSAGTSAFANYLDRFGDAWVETRNDATPATREVRLKRLTEYKPLFDEADRFLLLQGEELTHAALNGGTIHMNVTNLAEQLAPQNGATVADTIASNFAVVRQAAAATGRPLLFVTNHPNYQWGVTAEDFAAVADSRFFEIWNGVVGDDDPGDAIHPSTDEIWDIANTLRMAGKGALPLLGLATDDAHQYHGNKNGYLRPGRAWIMVRATSLTAEALLQAVNAGDFYASTGVELDDVAFDPATRRLALKIHPKAGETFVTRFIGTRRGANLIGKPRVDTSGNAVQTTLDYRTAAGPQIGEVLAQSADPNPIYVFQGDELYVRAVVTSSAAPAVGGGEAAFQQAWTQPVFTPDDSDADGDGLTGDQEAWQYGTNPTLADTDGDGLPDGVEVLQTLTDPLRSHAVAVRYIQTHLVATPLPILWRDPAQNSLHLRLGLQGTDDLGQAWRDMAPTGAEGTAGTLRLPLPGTADAKRFFRFKATAPPAAPVS